MAAEDKSYATMRGLGILDPRAISDNLWAAQSSFSQANPKPGVPDPQQPTDMILQTSGQQPASKALRVGTIRAGMPGVADSSAGMVWQYNGDALWRGCDIPSVITGWEAAEWTDGTGVTTLATGSSAILSLSNGDVLVAYYQKYATIPTTYRVATKVRSASTNTFGSSVTVYSQEAALTQDLVSQGFYPGLVQLPSGRVLLFFWLEDTTTSTAQITQYFSDDNGASWTQGTKYCLVDTLSIHSSTGYKYARLSIAYQAGQLMMVGHIQSNDSSRNYTDTLYQWYSDDLGASWVGVAEIWDGTAKGGGYPTLLYTGGLWQCYYLSSTDRKAARLRTSSPVFSLANDTEAVYGQPLFPALSAPGADIPEIYVALTVVKADDGALWMLSNEAVDHSPSSATSNIFGIMLRSTDAGGTWEAVGQSGRLSSYSIFWDSNSATTYPRYYQGCWQGGRLILSHNWKAAPGNEGNSLGVMYLGGWSTVTMPGYTLFEKTTSRVSFDYSWLPFDIPGAYTNKGPWDANKTGSPTEALSSGALSLTCTAGNFVYYSKTSSSPANTGHTVTDAPVQGVILRATLAVASGGSLTSDLAAIRVRIADGSDGYDVSVRFNSTTIRVVDNNAAAQVGGDISVAVSGGVQVLLAVANGNCSLWYRVSSTSSDREWIAGASSTSLNNSVSAGTTYYTHWGTMASGAAAMTWTEFHITEGWTTGQQIAQGQSNPSELFPRVVSPSPVSVDGGTHLAGIDGPAFNNDQWHIDTRYEYSWDRMLPAAHPSPQIGWRSVADGVEERIALLYPGHGGTGTSGQMGDILCLYLDGCNWRQGKLQGWNGSAWVDLVDIDMADSLAGLPYTRVGDAIKVDTGTAFTGNRYIMPSELVGATADLGSSKLRKVQQHDDGVWRNTTTKRPVFILSDTDNTEPASGTCNIWSKRSAIVKYLQGVRYGGYRLLISSQTTADGYYSVGVAYLGTVWPFGYQNSWDRSISTEANTDLRSFADGQRVATKLGPSRRTISLSWSDPIDMTNVQGHQPDPNYQLDSTSSGQPVASRVGTPWVLEGLVNTLDGSRIPVVYFPILPQGDGGTSSYQFVQRYASCYARLTSAVRTDGVVGDELTSEVVRVSTITLEEEV